MIYSWGNCGSVHGELFIEPSLEDKFSLNVALTVLYHMISPHPHHEFLISVPTKWIYF